MFQQLVLLLRQRSVLLTVTLLEQDQVRVNVMPKKLADSENTALTTPMSFTGTAEELDTQLPSTLVSYVASHLDLKATLEKAKEEMAAAAKAAQEEARNKSKSVKKASDTTAKAKPTEVSDVEEREKRRKSRLRLVCQDSLTRPQPQLQHLPDLRHRPLIWTRRASCWRRSRRPSTTTTTQMKPPDGVVSRVWELLHRPDYENARSHLRALFSGSRRKGVLTMNAQYSTSGSNTWIVDVMDNDTVITAAEADSEENAMAMARTSAHALYGSRAAMFEYAVYPPSPRAMKSKATIAAAKGLHGEHNGRRVRA